MSKNKGFSAWSYRLRQSGYARIVSGGLICIIPVLMIGAFALVLMTLPVRGYVDFITCYGGGFIYNVLKMIYDATFGLLSIYMVLALAYTGAQEEGQSGVKTICRSMVSLAGFFILTGVFSGRFALSNFGPKGMISAIICGYALPQLNDSLCRAIELPRRRAYTDGADYRFNYVVSMVPTTAVLLLALAVVSEIVGRQMDVATLQELIAKIVGLLFEAMPAGFFSGLLYVLACSVLWFFGIHGSDCLESVSEVHFAPGIDVNAAAVAAGQAPTEILTKQFFDVFVLIGGCGSALCLLLALVLFGRRGSDRKLARMAVVPMIFNVNEIMIFGLPVIFNPVMLIPFILTPLTCYVLSYAALSAGLVGLTVHSVEWTTPVVLGGYAATGGISGSVLQLVNLAVGTAIYAPFIKLMDKQKEMREEDGYRRLVEYYKRYEEDAGEVTLTALENELGATAKIIALDLQTWMDSQEPTLYYQPQYRYDGSCFGAEALLRWKHERFGLIYPPLVIKLADEEGRLSQLERSVLSRAVSQLPALKRTLGEDVELSVNITGKTLASEGFIDYVAETTEGTSGVCIEITEQTALRFDDDTNRLLERLRQLNIGLAIDDFSMGQTSINYLKNNYFNMVKLDGLLVREIMSNPRCFEIINSIVSLAKSLELSVLAEYVDSDEMKEKLRSAGCLLYQGYLFSPAVPLEELEVNREKYQRAESASWAAETAEV